MSPQSSSARLFAFFLVFVIFFWMFRIETTKGRCQELQGLNCDGIDGLYIQGTIYYDNTKETMRYNVVVEDDARTGFYNDFNFTTTIEWYYNVNDNSRTPVVGDKSKSIFIDSNVGDSNYKKLIIMQVDSLNQLIIDSSDSMNHLSITVILIKIQHVILVSS